MIITVIIVMVVVLITYTTVGCNANSVGGKVRLKCDNKKCLSNNKTEITELHVTSTLDLNH